MPLQTIGRCVRSAQVANASHAGTSRNFDALRQFMQWRGCVEMLAPLIARQSILTTPQTPSRQYILFEWNKEARC
jgi:hypothetical protein